MISRVLLMDFLLVNSMALCTSPTVTPSFFTWHFHQSTKLFEMDANVDSAVTLKMMMVVVVFLSLWFRNQNTGSFVWLCVVGLQTVPSSSRLPRLYYTTPYCFRSVVCTDQCFVFLVQTLRRCIGQAFILQLLLAAMRFVVDCVTTWCLHKEIYEPKEVPRTGGKYTLFVLWSDDV
jgi:hypothetical protein